MLATRAVATLAAVSLLLGACSSDTGSSDKSFASSFNQPFANARFYPVLASTDLTVGRNQFLVGLNNQNDAPVARPQIRMHIDFFDLDAGSRDPASSMAMRFHWIDKPYKGLYVGFPTFDSPGKWGAEVALSGGGVDENLRASFAVNKRSSTPPIGSKAPATDTPTATSATGIKKISTDPHPDPRFYRVSVAQALTRHEPFVLVFASPKFCVSEVCGPTLDEVKDVAPSFPHVTFIHVEAYQLPATPSNLKPVATAVQWGLPSEPWVFVVDRTGRVTAKYEGTFLPSDLRRELSSL